MDKIKAEQLSIHIHEIFLQNQIVVYNTNRAWGKLTISISGLDDLFESNVSYEYSLKYGYKFNY